MEYYPKIYIKISFKKAFSIFIKDLRKINQPFFLEDFKLPNLIEKNKYKIPKNIKEFKKFFDFYLIIIIFLWFLYLYILNIKNIIKIYKKILKNKNLIEKIIRIIPNYTNNKWSINNINIYICIKNWAESINNEILIGIKPKNILNNENNLIGIIIHESIHCNTQKEFDAKIKKLTNDEKIKLAEELAVLILTRKIQNIELNLNSENLQPLTSEFKFINNKNFKNFEQKIKNINSFNQLVIQSYFFIKENGGV